MKRIGYLVLVTNYETIRKRYYIYRCLLTDDFNFNNINDIYLVDHTDAKEKIRMLINNIGLKMKSCHTRPDGRTKVIVYET